MIFNSKFYFAFPTKLDTRHVRHSCVKQLIHQILNTYQLNQYAKLRLKTPFLFPNPFVYYKHCYIYIWNDIIQEHEQKTWLNYLFHSINICHWCHFVYKISTKKIKIHTFLSSWKTNSNENGDTWVQHFILYNYLKTNKVQKLKFDIFPLIGETLNINIWG